MQTEKKQFYKLLWTLCLPLLFQQFFTALINILDTFMLGSLSESVITAAGLAGKIFFLFIVVIYGVTSGAAIFMAQYWGKKDINNIHKTMGISFIYSLFFACAFAAVALAAPQAIMTAFSKDPEVVALGAGYLRFIAVSYIFTAVSQTFYAALKSVNKTLIPAAFTVVALVANAGFNALFIFGLNWGIKGAAIATVIARFIELTALIITLAAVKSPVWARSKEYFTFTRAQMSRFIKIAGLVVLTEFEWALGTTLYVVAYRKYGTPYQTSLQITDSIVFLLNVLAMSLGNAASIIIGNTIGAGEKEKARLYGKRFYWLALAAGGVLTALLLILAPFAPLAFNISAEVRGYTTICMLIMAASSPFRCIEFMLMVGILRSGGDTVFCVLCDFVSVWLITLPLLLLSAYVFNLGFFALYVIMCIEQALKLIAGTIRLRRGKWINNVTVSADTHSVPEPA